MIEKKNEESGTVYLRLFVEPDRLVRMVCYRALIDAPVDAADHTWFGAFTLKVDRAPIGVEPHTYDEFAAFYAASAATDRRLDP